ncbi:MAG: C10 family peptidase [Bacteroidaceae bacterium]|nr:C10 family peptidase [Bacteroidaceae bacterium]
MNRLLFFSVCLLTSQFTFAQKIIKKSNRHFVEEQTLPSRVDPLLSDVWHQDAPFNNLCPIDSTTNKRSLVGCVATSMTEVMNYWKWPNTYDWKNILDNYDDVEYTQQQADAIAKLSYDCSISVKMKFGSEASGARSIYQPLAMANLFDYDRGIQMYYRDFYSLSEITLMLKTELAAGRPVLISGYNPNGGHAFVLDGYDENDYFHACWGNKGGQDNDWTYLMNMVPNQPEWYEKDSPEQGYNILQMFTIGIMPSNNEAATGIERHLFTFQNICAVRNENGAAQYDKDFVKIAVHDMSNIGWNTLEDSVSIMLKKDGEIVQPLYTYTHDFLLEEIDDTTYTDTLCFSLPKNLKNGTYSIVPMYRDNSLTGGKEWREARVCTGTPNYLIATLKNDMVTLVSDTASTSFLTLENITFPDLIYADLAPDYSASFKNHGPEMVGRIYFVLESLDDEKSFYLNSQGFSVGENEMYEINNRLRKVAPPKYGSYRLCVKYESNLFADDLIDLKLEEDIIVTILPSASKIEIAMQ